MRAINDIIFGMANNRGFGTFFWEPTTGVGSDRRSRRGGFQIRDQVRSEP